MMQSAIRTAGAPAPGGFYSQAVQAGPMLYISGQLPVAQGGHIVGGTATEQVRYVMQSIRAILQAAAGDLENLVQVTIYVSDIALWPEVNLAYQEALAHVPVPPARAVVPVKELHYGALVEIQATAYLPREGK